MAANGDITNFIKDLINQNKVVVFSESTCQYTKLATEAFEKVDQSITVLELDERKDGKEIMSSLAEITGFKTLPQVFINGKCVGGGSNVRALYDSGRLQPLLAGVNPTVRSIMTRYTCQQS